MDLQTAFYLFAIFFMGLSILLVIFIAIVFFLIYRRFENLQSLIELKINQLATPAEIAMDVGANVAKTALKKVRKLIDNNEKDK